MSTKRKEEWRERDQSPFLVPSVPCSSRTDWGAAHIHNKTASPFCAVPRGDSHAKVRDALLKRRASVVPFASRYIIRIGRREDACLRFSLSLLRLNLYMRRHVRRRRILLGLSNVDSSDCGMEWRRRRGRWDARACAYGGFPSLPRCRHECGLTNL